MEGIVVHETAKVDGGCLKLCYRRLPAGEVVWFVHVAAVSIESSSYAVAFDCGDVTQANELYRTIKDKCMLRPG